MAVTFFHTYLLFTYQFRTSMRTPTTHTSTHLPKKNTHPSSSGTRPLLILYWLMSMDLRAIPSRYPKMEFLKFSLQVNCWEVHSHLHRAISIFKIQFAGATTTSRYQKKNFWNSACRLTVEKYFPKSPWSNFEFQNSVSRWYNHFQKEIFEIQLAG